MRRRWLYFLPALLIVGTAVAVRLISGDGSEDASPAASTSAASSTAPGASTTPTSASTPPPPVEADDPIPVAMDLTTVDRRSPKAVATAWGCAYWAHPRGETAEALAARLAPLSTPEMTAAVAQLRIPDFGRHLVEAYPGVTEPTDRPNTYSVGCQTRTTGPDGAPTAPPAAVLPEVTVVASGDQWLVSAAIIGGLVLP